MDENCPAMTKLGAEVGTNTDSSSHTNLDVFVHTTPRLLTFRGFRLLVLTKGCVHHDSLPARISLFENEKIISTEWRRHGILHRDNNKPAGIMKDISGGFAFMWFNAGLRHRTDGPAFIQKIFGVNKTERWIRGKKMSNL